MMLKRSSQAGGKTLRPLKIPRQAFIDVVKKITTYCVELKESEVNCDILKGAPEKGRHA